MAKSGIGCKFHDLKYFEVGNFSHITRIHYKLEASLQMFVEKH